MKYTLNSETDKEFTEQFLKKYMALGFGNLPKKEIDILVFTLITKLGYIEGKDYYSIAKELMIEEKKVKRYIIDSSLRNDTDDTVPNSIRKIKDDIFINKTVQPEFEDEKYIIIMISDPIVRRDFVYTLKCLGYSFDENLNEERIKLPIYAFMAVFCRYDDNIYLNFKKLAKEKIKSDSDKEKAFRDALPLLQKIKNGIELANIPLNSVSAIASILGVLPA